MAESRERAQALIAAGDVLVGGMSAQKASRLVDEAEAIVLAGPPARFVSRGGDKLDAALDNFAVAVTGRRALDAGASTGGFTDCLLQRGAAEVVAVDVGYGQLHPRLRRDPRVAVLERTNVRYLDGEAVGGRPFDLLVADLSFISLRAVVPVLTGDLAGAGADAVVLVKPQFEAGRAEASKARGVIRSPAIWRRTLGEVCTTFAANGAAMMDVMVSPLKGADGNVEFLLHVRPHAVAPPPGDEMDRALDAVVDAAADGEQR